MEFHILKILPDIFQEKSIPDEILKENMMKKHHANIDEDIITEFLCTGTADFLEDYLVTMRETAKEYVSEIFRSVGMNTNILTPFECGSFTKLFSKDRANKYFEKGQVVFFAGGTGHPYFSTDTGVMLRAIEVEAEVILLAKAIDGVYDDDPKKNPDAVKFDSLKYIDVLNQGLKVMDSTAISLCMDNNIPLIVFDMMTPGNMKRAAMGETIGTYVGR